MTLNTLFTILADMEIQQGKDSSKTTSTWKAIYFDPYNYFVKTLK